MKIKAKIQGTTPLLMNRFSGDGDRTSKAIRPNGDPRKDAARKLYADEAGNLFVPAVNVFSCLIAAGRFHKAGKNKLTTQRTSLIPAGMSIEQLICPLETKDWSVDSRAVVNPATGGRMICHRPMLEKWSLSFTLEIDAEMFSLDLAERLLIDAGKRIGLGDFRPERKGPFGKFDVLEFKEVA